MDFDLSGNGIRVERLAWDEKAPVRLPASPTILSKREMNLNRDMR